VIARASASTIKSSKREESRRALTLSEKAELKIQERLTTFEALACRLPIIADVITDPMPQEAGPLA
jgi:hypothetical protein